MSMSTHPHLAPRLMAAANALEQALQSYNEAAFQDTKQLIDEVAQKVPDFMVEAMCANMVLDRHLDGSPGTFEHFALQDLVIMLRQLGTSTDAPAVSLYQKFQTDPGRAPVVLYREGAGEDEGRFWSNDAGWVDLDSATSFDPKSIPGLRMLLGEPGQFAVFMPAAKAVDLHLQQILAQEGEQRPATRAPRP